MRQSMRNESQEQSTWRETSQKQEDKVTLQNKRPDNKTPKNILHMCAIITMSSTDFI